MAVHMRIMCMDDGPQIVADLPSWAGPVPRVGEYIYHPPQEFGVGMPDAGGGVAGCVKSVLYRTHDRGPGGFVQTAHPYVEVWL